VANYVDGFVIPVPKDRLAEYRKLARKGAKIWLEYGALEYVECEGDDVPWGKRTSFPRSVKLKEDETVIFAWIVYRSKADRNRINRKAMTDPRFAGMDFKSMPFDAKRMVYGGFKTFVRSSQTS